MDAHRLISHLVVEKQANGESTPLTLPRRNQLKQDAANYIANLAAASFAMGGMGAGLQGLLGMFQRRKLPYHKQTAEGVPIPVTPPEEEEEAKLAGFPALTKLAQKPSLEDWASGEWQPHDRNILGNTVGQLLYNTLLRTDKDNPSWWAGDMAKHITSVPATLGVGLPLALGSLYGGYKLTGGLINARRKAEKDEELEAAKQRYAELAGLAPQMTKQLKTSADAGGTAELFDRLAEELLAKQANELEVNEAPGLGRTTRDLATNTGTADLGSLGLGALLGWGLLSGLGTGYMGYQWGKKHSRTKLIEEAMKRRARERARAAGGRMPLRFYLPEDKEENEKKVAA